MHLLKMDRKHSYLNYFLGIQELGLRCAGTGHLCPGIRLEISFNFVGITPLLFEEYSGK